MLTAKDLEKIITAQEKVFATKEDLEEMQDSIREDLSHLLTAVDQYS